MCPLFELSAIAERMVGDVIRQGHATPYLCPDVNRRGAAASDGGLTLAGSVRPAPLPDRARQRPPGAGPADRPLLGLLGPGRAQRPPGVQRPRLGGAGTRFDPAQDQPGPLYPRPGRATAGPAPPEPSQLRAPDQPLDVAVGRED